MGCNALTGADTLVIDERESDLSSSGHTPAGPDGELTGGSTTTTSSSSGSTGNSASSSSSGGAPPDAGSDAPPSPPSSGTVIDETFASTGACNGVTVTNGAMTTYVPEGRNDAGACRICATVAGEMYIELSGSAAKQGQATFEAYARRVPGAATPTSATIQLRIDGSSVSSSNGIGETWVRLGGGSITVDSGASVLLRVGVPNATGGECLLIDDARVIVP